MQNGTEAHGDASDAESAMSLQLAVLGLARGEIDTRMRLREQYLLAFQAGSVAILSAAFLSQNSMISLMVPASGLAMSLLVAGHTVTIHQICQWTRTLPVEHWAKSDLRRELHQTSLPARSFAHLVSFVVPSVVGLGHSFSKAFLTPSVSASGLWWACVVCVLAMVWVQQWSLARVRRLSDTESQSPRLTNGKLSAPTVNGASRTVSPEQHPPTGK